MKSRERSGTVGDEDRDDKGVENQADEDAERTKEIEREKEQKCRYQNLEGRGLWIRTALTMI